MEIIHYFLCLEMSASKALKYLNDNKKIKIFETALLKVYSELRLIIYLYMKILYESEAISTKNNRDYFSVDESLINHINNKQIWLLSIINNTSKEFSIKVSYNRDSGTLANYIQKYIEIENTIISNGCSGYNFLDSAQSGYSHITHIHHGGNFGYGMQSNSHIESIWNIIKGKIKTIYHVIPKFHSIFGERNLIEL